MSGTSESPWSDAASPRFQVWKKSVFENFKDKLSVGLEYWASDGKQEVPAAGQPLKITDGNQEDVTASLCPTCAAKEISVNANLWVEREAAKEEQMFSLHSWLFPEMVLL